MRVTLVSTYDLGRQPFGLASPAAWLRQAGFEVTCVDVSRELLTPASIRSANLVAFFLPMHTATRLAQPVIRKVAGWNPAAHLCAYGLYAPPNARWLQSLGVTTILGGEFEEDLRGLARRLAGPDVVARKEERVAAILPGTRTFVPRLEFRVPDRRTLPALPAYATLHLPDGRTRTVGYTEASRGCRHVCRHCPVVPVYDGQFRVVPVDVVLRDIQQQVEAGAEHITFGDPDFFNGVGHAMRVVEAVSRDFPGVSYDATIKVEHLLRHATRLPQLRETGCLFITTAVESIDPEVLERLEKGHTPAEFEQVVGLCRAVGLALAPTFIPFTPWTTIEGYRALLASIEALDLVGHVPPIQLTLRLLIPEGSRLLGLPEIQATTQPFDEAALVYPWAHADSRVDALQRDATRVVRSQASSARAAVFAALQELADRYAGVVPSGPLDLVPLPRTAVPYLNEPWYC